MDSGSRHASGELVRAYASQGDDSRRRGVLVAQGHAARELVQQISLLANAPGSVLIAGETGTGKTLVARELHAQSKAAALPLRVINCAALPEAVLADMLWQLDEPAVPSEGAAHEEPACVLLDEVGELSPWAQAVLLRKVQPGGQSVRGMRFLAATHRDLSSMAQAGTFSRELLTRLSTHRLRLVPLRARRDEIAPLALHFLRAALQDAGQSFVSVDPHFVKCLETYDWPGNARELNNAMVRALAANEDGVLSPSDLPDPLRARALAVVQGW